MARAGEQEGSLTAHKIVHYNNAFARRKGRPQLFFLAQLTDAGAFRSPTTRHRLAIWELEALLIGMALSRNPSLLNQNGIKFQKRLIAEGLINSDKRGATPDAKRLRQVLWG